MIRPANTAQDGWSTNEQIIYRVIWEKGVETEPQIRKTQIGTATIMAQTGLRETAARAGIKGLKAKKDILLTIPPSDPVTPATYLVFSFRRIIDRRAEVDLLYCERPANSREVRLLTTSEARARWNLGERFKTRPGDFFASAAPPAPAGERARPSPAAQTDPAEKPARSSVTPIARSSAIAMKPEDWTAIRAELGDLADGNMTAEADLRKADLADNPGLPIQVTVLKVRGLAHQVRASRGGIHSPIAWMLKNIGGMVIDVEAETKKAAAALSADKAAAEAAASAEAIRQKAEKTRLRISPAAADKGQAAWKAILAELKKQVIRQSFETWLQPTKGAWIKAKTLTVRVPSVEFQHIGNKYGDLIQAAIGSIGLKLDDVQFVAEGVES